MIWTDRDGTEAHGVYRFTLGGLASITLDEVQPDGHRPLFKSLRVCPTTIRREPAKELV